MPRETHHDFSGDCTREVIGAFYEVYNGLPRGLLESAYVGALELELMHLGIAVDREVCVPLYYRGRIVGMYRADLIVDGKLILEIKAMSRVGDAEKRQLFHYLRVTRIKLGLLLNFGPFPQVARVINSGSGEMKRAPRGTIGETPIAE